MKRDAAAGAGLALLGLVALAGAPSRDPVAGVMGPGVLPSLVALGLVLTGLGLVLAAMVQGRARSGAGGARGPAQAAGVPAAVTGTPAVTSGAAASTSAGAPAEAAAGARADVIAKDPAAGGLEAAGRGSSTVGAGSPAGASPAAAAREGRVRLLVTIGALGAYTVALPVLGFPVASAVLVSGLAWYLGERRPLAALLWGVLLAVALWAGFVRGLGVPLPMGVLDR
ncbi:tripartite tricarboxylate transporter TctB family protein [Thermaerobacter sp. PB12/4term]|uniref:tripartite tricarboxylate transporter TctB family protein n=1 Tax=Thermaerobacter sp. PB12/4term TaxID=2293838 RepID=UPI000E327838|nr:tripartite tricarboxylate transporter TctB family protein [Thermaerobacter sp. PB12/4term]QIA26768.1 tripartite tricarboxylate transporter TctB family protein [Thermaerobacter sp. PB12/4term]